jgi:hypothetical protein
MRRIFAVVGLSFVLAGAGSTVALATPSPSGPGLPNQSCQSFSPTTRPGTSYLSRGSVFNEGAGVNSTNGGIGGNAYNNAGAPSQYDMACFQASLH